MTADTGCSVTTCPADVAAIAKALLPAQEQARAIQWRTPMRQTSDDIDRATAPILGMDPDGPELWEEWEELYRFTFEELMEVAFYWDSRGFPDVLKTIEQVVNARWTAAQVHTLLEASLTRLALPASVEANRCLL